MRVAEVKTHGELNRLLLTCFIEKMNRASSELQREDLDAVRAAGWNDEALYDAITVCALFNFYNNWIDACGVADMPAAAYAASGERLAKFGYIPAEAPPG